MKRFKSDCFLYSLGGFTYAFLEILFRKRTHWSMVITGGACFLIIYRFYQKFPNLLLRYKCLIGGGIITILECICGFIVNIKYNLNVWDYSNLPLNFKGQICPLFSLLWVLLCIPVSGLCKSLRKSKKLK